MLTSSLLGHGTREEEVALILVLLVPKLELASDLRCRVVKTQTQGFDGDLTILVHFHFKIHAMPLGTTF